MQTLTTILKNAIVLTMNQDYEIFEPGAIAIDGDTIVAVGSQEDILSNYQATEMIDCGKKVLMPGLINARLSLCGLVPNWVAQNLSALGLQLSMICITSRITLQKRLLRLVCGRWLVKQ